MPSIDKLGRYEIRRELGRGAMGVVYEAYDPMIKRLVALKTIRADQLARDDAALVLARFRREAQAAGRLNHPNIVSIYDFDEDAGTAFIAMEPVDGRELRDIFDAGERFTTADAVRLTGQILDALDYSHRQGVVHRDMKPANVFVQKDGNVKVADFGIAHVDSSSLTQDGSVMGTPNYMSPEQILGLPVDGRSDLFSVGVILYQFLTGERPFAGSSTTTMQKVLKEDPLPPSTLNVQLPDALDAVVHRALAKKPDDRYPTAAAFAADLRAAAGPRPAGAAAPATHARASPSTDATVLAAPGAAASATVPNAPPITSPPSPSPPPRQSQGVAIALVVSVVALAIVAVVWMGLQSRDRREERALTAATTQPPAVAPAPPAPVVAAPVPVPTHAIAPPSSAVPAPVSGTLVIAALGLADPTNPRYQGNAALLQSDLRADAKSQLVEKALGLLVEPKSLAQNYAMLSERVLAKSSGFIDTVVRESEPRVRKDGLMSMTTEAVVNVKAVQKSLNQMSRDERVQLIRARGDPRIAMHIVVRDADRPEIPPRASPVAENLLKERIKSFGFRTWTGAPGDAGKSGDFVVNADAQVRRLSTRLDASGITVHKYAVTALTVKCVDQASGEEIYFKTVLPKGTGSWATEEEALKAVGETVADQFSRDFFLQHVHVAGQRVALHIDGLPDAKTAELVGGELVGLPAVIAARPRTTANPAAWDLELAGSGAPGDLVVSGVVAPLNAKLGQACLAVGATTAADVRVTFDPRCNDAEVLSKLETNPPAGLYNAPPARQKSVISNPETLRKLSI